MSSKHEIITILGISGPAINHLTSKPAEQCAAAACSAPHIWLLNGIGACADAAHDVEVRAAGSAAFGKALSAAYNNLPRIVAQRDWDALERATADRWADRNRR